MSYFLVVIAFNRGNPNPSIILNNSLLRYYVIFILRRLYFAYNNGGSTLIITRYCLDLNLLRISYIRDRDSFVKAVLPKVYYDFRKESLVRR